MVRQVGLHLVSKLRHNSALYLPYSGPYAGRGPHRKYGKKLDYRHIPAAYLQVTSIDEEIETHIYQLTLWHKKFAEMLNVVVIVKTNVQTHKMAHVVLFSSDVTLGYAQLIDYYRLRFQLEFNSTVVFWLRIGTTSSCHERRLLGEQSGKDIGCPLPELESLMSIQDQRLNEGLRLLATRFPDGFDGQAPFGR